MRITRQRMKIIAQIEYDIIIDNSFQL